MLAALSQPETYQIAAGTLCAALGLPLPGCIAGTAAGLCLIALLRWAFRGMRI